MPKEKSHNPVTAHNRAQKAKQIKKNKAAVGKQRAERLSRRDPHRLQRQIDDLENSNTRLSETEKRRLEEMKNDLARIRKARDRLGVPGPERGVLGKRRRDDRKAEEDEDESSTTDSDAGDIPMPADVENMPPLPRAFGRKRGMPQEEEPQVSEPVPAQKVYEAKPQIRNLIQESTSRFVPTSVASRVQKPNTQHGSELMEPEELDRLEREAEARKAAKHAAGEAEKELEYKLMAMEEELGETKTLEEEERRFRMESRKVEMEEVEDEDL
jgi:hypothetical protein